MTAPATSSVTLLELESADGQKLTQLGKINLIVGRNGCGKSTALKRIDQRFARAPKAPPVRYITPERAGVLQYDPNVDASVSSNPEWMRETRRKNQFTQFKQQTLSLYRKLELLVLRGIEKDRASKDDFDSVVREINKLLDNIKLVRDAESFSIRDRADGKKIETAEISSGESELIALAIEAATFAWECKGLDLGWLLLDEPDVHLHPDLQHRLAEMLLKSVENSGMRIIISTHSTALLAALAEDPNSRVAFMMNKAQSLDFREINTAMRAVLPVFGAHPLSAVFNRQKLLIVEGEDDERIWRRVYRSSEGRINVYPVAAGDIDRLNGLETEAAEILGSIYDSAKAWSLRDRDGVEGNLDPIGPVQRFRLGCRSAENLLLANDTLAMLGTDWAKVKAALDKWIEWNKAHPHHKEMLAFQAAGFLRRDHRLKEIRNDLLAVIGTNKSWEDAVGLSIAKLVVCPTTGGDSLQAYLGNGLCQALINSA